MRSGSNLEGFHVCGRYSMKVSMRTSKVVGWCLRTASTEVFIVASLSISIIRAWGYYTVLGHGLAIL